MVLIEYLYFCRPTLAIQTLNLLMTVAFQLKTNIEECTELKRQSHKTPRLHLPHYSYGIRNKHIMAPIISAWATLPTNVLRVACHRILKVHPENLNFSSLISIVSFLFLFSLNFSWNLWFFWFWFELNEFQFLDNIKISTEFIAIGAWLKYEIDQKRIWIRNYLVYHLNSFLEIINFDLKRSIIKKLVFYSIFVFDGSKKSFMDEENKMRYKVHLMKTCQTV